MNSSTRTKLRYKAWTEKQSLRSDDIATDVNDCQAKGQTEEIRRMKQTESVTNNNKQFWLASTRAKVGKESECVSEHSEYKVEQGRINSR